MEENAGGNAEIIKQLNAEYPAVRRETAEMLISEQIPDEVAKILASKLTDDDKGVRDAVSVTLSYNDNQAIAQFVVPYISSEDISVRNLAGDILIKRGTASIPAMLDYLPTGDDDDKKFLIDIFSIIADPAPKNEVLEILKQTENENVALACIEALGSMRVEESISELEKVFANHELYRPTIAESLGKIGSKDALNFLMEKYDDVDQLTQFSILESLGEIGDEEIFFFLIGKLRDSTPPQTWAIIKSLSLLKDKLSLDVPYDESTRNAVLSTILDAEVQYKRAAASLLSYFRDNEVFGVCFNIIGADAEIDESIKPMFYGSPEQFYQKVSDYLKQEQENLNAILELMKELIENLGPAHLEELGTLKMHNMCEKLAQCLTHPNEEVRRSSMELLFFLSPETAFVFTDTMTTDKNVWNRMRLVEILESFEGDEALQALKELQGDEEDMVRQRVEFILSQRGTTD